MVKEYKVAAGTMLKSLDIDIVAYAGLQLTAVLELRLPDLQEMNTQHRIILQANG